MNSIQAIIEKILVDGKIEVEKNISEAKQKAAEILSIAKEKADFTKKAYADQAKADGEELIKRRRIVTKLDCNKILLSKKKEVVDLIFSKAVDTLRLDKKKYLDFLKKMLEKNCDDGDLVIICKEDKDIITSKFISEVSKKMGKEILLGNEFGDFNGGFILCGKKYDKNLSLSLALQDMREELERKVVDIMFKETI